MRLRTYESYWLLKNGLLHTYPSVNQNLKADIVVIGAGITGALISHTLRKKGHKVIVLDKGDVGGGSTSATTSMLQYEIDETLHDLSEMIGEDGAAKCYLEGLKAIDELQKLVKTERINCGFQMKNSLYTSHSLQASKKLRVEFEMRKKIKLPVSWLGPAEVKRKYGIKSFGAILSRKGACVDAYRLAHGLFYKNSRRAKIPIQVFDQSRIKEIKESSSGVRISIDNGYHISCNKVVYCNGFEAINVLKENVASLFDTYACVSEPQKLLRKSLKHTLIWDTDDPYFYMRATDDDRLLMGGEDSAFRLGFLRQKIKAHKADKLIARLKELAPEVDFVEDFTWAGTFGKTKDGLPYIGKSPEFKHAFFVLGFGGNGITFSTTAMKILPLLMEGKHHELAQYYRFGR